jgi:hypothetical protein
VGEKGQKKRVGTDGHTKFKLKKIVQFVKHDGERNIEELTT